MHRQCNNGIAISHQKLRSPVFRFCAVYYNFLIDIVKERSGFVDGMSHGRFWFATVCEVKERKTCTTGTNQYKAAPPPLIHVVYNNNTLSCIHSIPQRIIRTTRRHRRRRRSAAVLVASCNHGWHPNN